MKKMFIILKGIFFATVCSAQVNDNFEDGDFTANPQWTPDMPGNWVVENGQLRSNAAVANTTFYITTPSAKATEAQWEFWVNLRFNTSGANYADVFLIADQANLQSATLNGYFVRIGGTPDEISLYKMVNGTASILVNGTDGITNSSSNTLRIKVIRDAGNTWTLQRDATGGTNYFVEGTVVDNTFSTSGYFGIRVQQSTSGFFNRHFFDDVYVGEIILDNEPPVVQQIQVANQNQLQVIFNEPVQTASAQAVSHYHVSGGVGNPVSAQLQPDEKTVLLTFTQNFQNGITHQLTINGIADLPGNVMPEAVLPFVFFQPLPVSYKDIILTEIFPDPSPQVGLPDAEFVEIYNRSTNPVDLAGWRFTDGSSTATLTSRIILPGQYLILTSSANASLYNSFGNTLGAGNFPTLNNAGEALMLRAPDNRLVDSVNYNTAWYRDEDKKEGGWTLELIDVHNPCGEEDNWTASEAQQGGTPGYVNSVHANKPDVTGPQLVAATAAGTQEVLLVFNEKLERQTSKADFEIEPLVEIEALSFTSTSLREVKLKLTTPLQARELYTVKAVSVRDCAGNFIQHDYNSFTVALPEQAEQGDILLNEILFNPKPGGVDFVELVNTSEKYINLKGWSLADYADQAVTNTRVITAQDYILSPGAYLVTTTNGTILKNHYPKAKEDRFLITTIPAMNDGSGSVALISDEGTLFDYLLYDADFHTPMLKDKEGVSLERVSLSNRINNRDNWKSAASASGFATPGFLNSNARPGIEISGDEVRIAPEIFSPDRPGQDFARIHYQFDHPGWVANIKIADQQGRVVKEIANNETLGTEGFFRWDGDNDNGYKARAGYYFVWFEAFTLDGTVKTFRKRVVVGQ
ncbi:MAG: lamin tail domain-containing protein [Cyclobacteriaceae bacterium]|nr:lamin tail domain-containing protein [Cyclobacteriaceae bacterium]